MNKKVSVVIPNWNGKEVLRECLKSLADQTYKDFEVIVIDNGSTDGSVKMINRNYSKTKVVRLKDNIGFAPAVNIGIVNSRAKYVVLMNNDTEADKEWLNELVNILEEQSEYAIAASKMLFYSKRSKVNTAGDVITKYGWAKQRGFGENSRNFNKQEPIFTASAGAAIYRRELFDEIGLFDERFFAYIEDVDLGFRAQLAGYRCVFVPTAKIYHHVSFTTKKLSNIGEYLVFRNTLAMILKNYPLRLLLKYFFHVNYAIIARIFMDMNIKRILQDLRGLLGFIIMIPYLVKKRSEVRKISKKDAKYIDSFMVDEKPFVSLLWGNSE